MAASSITSPKFSPMPSRKVRVLGKIRGFTKSESLITDSKPWINVSKHQEDASTVSKVTVSFSDQSGNSSKKDSSYELNECYQQNEDIDVLFTREIGPLILEVFKGRDVSIIAYGARGSGKTTSIQGMEDKAGLSMMAMTELLSKARDLQKSVSLSIYEVFQEHAYDLLDPKHSEIQVLEDARGRIKLKGLSKVSVESLSQFDEYRSRSLTSKTGHSKTGQKAPLELPKRSHKVVVIYISSMDEPSSINRGGKMNFVDLAGYEDSRRKSSDGNNQSESVRINKSLHAIMNVIYALNTSDSRVPFRESKLTRMLQESLEGANPILLLACMNPLFCQDTVHIVSVASRSCQTIIQLIDSAKKSGSSTRVKALSSQKIVKPSVTPKVVKKQPDSSRALFPTKKASSMTSGRRIEKTKEIISNQAKASKGDVSVKMIDNLPESTTAVTILQPEQEEAKSPKGDISVMMVDNLQEITTEVTISQLELEEDPRNNSLTSSHLTLESDEVCQHKSTVEHEEGDSICKDNGNNNNLDAIPVVTEDKFIQEHGNNNNDLLTLGDGSPPLSERLRELSTSLKLFCSSAPSRQKLLQESIPAVPIEITEPKTPETENRNLNVKYSSPWDAFSKGSSRMKDSLVKESLNFLNTASKDELRKLKGIGEKRATWILELREESPEPFKNLEDLSDIGLSAKQIKGMMKNVAGELFS